MAKLIGDEKIRFSIIIDGHAAQKELHDLDKSTRKLNESNAQLRLEKGRLEKAGKTQTERYKELTQEIRENNAAITTNKAKTSELQKELGLAGLTMKQLTDKATQLKLVMRNLIPGSADHERYRKELIGVQTRLDQLNTEARKAKGTMESLADSFNKYQALAASVMIAVTGIVLALQQMIDYNGKLADAQANVMKTTRMNKEEVDELTKSFGMLQTRTSRIDLLKIAEEGGRIGIAKDEIGSFVEVMNKATVALGDSFTGGVSEVASKLGKLKFLFKETKDLNVDMAYNAIGSAINVLGANGVATERNIAEFATRLGSLNDALKPSISDALALGAAFEESGIEAEIAARAYSIFLNQAASESGKFAQVMGITQEEVERMINTNPMEFFLKFAQGLQGMDATQVAKTLDFLGVNADGANKALGAVANNSERFRELINMSGKALNEGSSLVEEYDVKNNNLAATMEKLKKVFAGMVSSEGFIDWLEGVVNWTAKLVGVTEDADGSGARWRHGILLTVKILAVLLASLVGFNAGLRLATLLTNGWTMSTTLLNIAVKAQAIGISFARLGLTIYTSTMGFFGVATDKASASLARMNLVSKASPWGAILGLITAVVVAYALFSEETKAAATNQTLLNSAMREADGMVHKQTTALNNLLAVARDETLDKHTRADAMERINALDREHLGHLTLENLKTLEGKKILDDYIGSLKQKAMLQVLEKRQAKLIEQIEERKGQSLQDEIKWYDELWIAAKNFGNVGAGGADAMVLASKRRTDALKKLQDELNLTDAQMKTFLEKNPGMIASVGGDESATSTSSYVVPDASDKASESKNKKASEERAKRLEMLERFKSDLLALERKTIDDKLALMKDGYEKELAIQNENHHRKLQDLTLQKKSEAELRALDSEISKAVKSGDKGKVTFLQEQKEHFLKVNSEINKQIEHEEQMHYAKLGIIKEREDERLIKSAEDKYKREKMLRETDFNNQLGEITTLSQAKDLLRGTLSEKELDQLKTLDAGKKALQEEFDKKEIEKQKEHLTELIEQLKTLTQSVNFEGIDLNILTPEQRAKVQAQIDELKHLLSGLNAKGGGESETGETDSFSNAVSSAFGTTDVLGFTNEQWDSAFNHFDTLEGKMNAAMMAVSTLQNLWSGYAAAVSANENAGLRNYERNLDVRKKRLKQQLDAGIINQAQYKRAVTSMEEEYEKKKMDIEYKQAKRKKTMSIVEAVINTAMAIMQAYAQLGPIGGTVAAVLIGALGALQVATIAKQPLPARGYEQGLYPEEVKRSQDGKVFKARNGGKTKSGMVSRATYFMAGENNYPEMVIDNKAWRKMNPELKDSLIREIRGVKGFESGYYNRSTFEVPIRGGGAGVFDDIRGGGAGREADPIRGGGAGIASDRLAGILSDVAEVLQDLRDNPISAVVSSRDEKSIDEIRKAVKKVEKRKQENKI